MPFRQSALEAGQKKQLKYRRLCRHLKPMEIYNAARIARISMEKGQLHDDPLTQERATHTLQKMLWDKLRDHPPDGFCLVDDKHKRGWYGWRISHAFYGSSKFGLVHLRYKFFEKSVSKHVHLATRLIFFTVLLALPAVYQFGVSMGSSPLTRLDELIKSPSASNIQALRTFLDDDQYHVLRTQIIRGIAESERRLSYPVPILEDFTKIKAVFAFPKNPTILLSDWSSLRLGNRVTIGGKHGYLSDISPLGIALDTPVGITTFDYPSQRILGKRPFQAAPVIIYQSPDNLKPLLDALCSMLNIELLGTLQPPANIVGSFECTDYTTFLHQVASKTALHFLPEEKRLEVMETDVVRAYIGYPHYFPKFHQTRLKELFNQIGTYMGYDMVYEIHGEMANNPALAFRPAQFSEICFDLDLDFAVDNGNRTITLSQPKDR